MEIIIVRHGETEYNKTRRLQGQQQVPLNENGRTQAKQVVESLKHCGITITYIYCSSLIRARETADIINEYFSLSVSIDSRLDERNFGVWENQTYDELIERYPSLENHFGWRIWNYNPDQSETLRGLIDRTIEFLKDVIRKHNETDTVLVVTHGGPVRAMLGFIRDLDEKEWMNVSIPNGTIFRVKFEDSKFILG